MQRTHVKKINEICVHSPPAWNKAVFGSSQPSAMVRSWWRHQKRSKRDVTSQNLKISLPQSCNGTSGTPGGRINWNFKIAQAEKGGGKPKMGHRRHTKNDPWNGRFHLWSLYRYPMWGDIHRQWWKAAWEATWLLNLTFPQPGCTASLVTILRLRQQLVPGSSLCTLPGRLAAKSRRTREEIPHQNSAEHFRSANLRCRVNFLNLLFVCTFEAYKRYLRSKLTGSCSHCSTAWRSAEWFSRCWYSMHSKVHGKPRDICFLISAFNVLQSNQKRSSAVVLGLRAVLESCGANSLDLFGILAPWNQVLSSYFLPDAWKFSEKTSLDLSKSVVQSLHHNKQGWNMAPLAHQPIL